MTIEIIIMNKCKREKWTDVSPGEKLHSSVSHVVHVKLYWGGIMSLRQELLEPHPNVNFEAFELAPKN